MSPLSIRPYTENSDHSNRIAGAVDYLGHRLTYLPSMLLKQGMQIGMPLAPGFYGQYNTYLKEICSRIIRLLFCILFSWGLALGMIGGCMRLAASFARRDFTFIHPDTAPLLEEKIEQVRIRTFNVAMMPECVCVRNRMRPTSQRIKEVADTLLEKDDDIICLQELFHTEAAAYLTARLREKFPYIVYNVAPRSFGLNSGLLTASRFPITHVDFWRHRDRSGIEHYSNKGSLAVTIKPNASQTLIVFNTHLNAAADVEDLFPEGGKSYRASQIEQLKEQVDSYIEQSLEEETSPPAVFLTGDYNIGPLTPIEDETTHQIVGARPDPEWTAIKSLMDPLISDEDASTTSFDLDRDPKAGWDLPKVEDWWTKPECLDHIGIPKTDKALHPVVLSARGTDDMGGCSDHLALYSIFSL